MAGAVSTTAFLSPTALASTKNGRTLFVACATANQVAVFDLESGKVIRRIEVPASPQGLVLSPDESRLYVACAAPASVICVIDTTQTTILDRIPAGHTAMSPVLSPDGKKLYVCNRFNHNLSVIDLMTRQESQRIAVSREPVAAVLSLDGKTLIVANHMYDERADGPGIAACISMIETETGRVFQSIQMPRGCGLLRGMALSPDGQYAAVTHLVARYYLSATNVAQGRINANGLSLVNLQHRSITRTVLLDQPDRGAANPWAVTWTPDGQYILVTLAGTHELMLVDAPALLRKRVVRKRVALPGNGPRALTVVGSQIYVANYFSDNLCRIDLTGATPDVVAIPLGIPVKPSLVRQGEILFNDAKLCLGEWQSCASCHDSDGRIDGMNWDLPNDGLGNPKNAKSLLFAHQTPPAMWSGVRKTAEAAVRAGLHNILFTNAPEDVAMAMDEYLKSLHPLPSPYLVNGKPSVAAERGQQLFLSRDVGCSTCHRPPLFTDRQLHDVGTIGSYDQPSDRFDTPGLHELWRTAPYLHDGSAAGLSDVLTRHSPGNGPGRASPLTPQQIDDLAAFLLSL